MTKGQLLTTYRAALMGNRPRCWPFSRPY